MFSKILTITDGHDIKVNSFEFVDSFTSFLADLQKSRAHKIIIRRSLGCPLYNVENKELKMNVSKKW